MLLFCRICFKFRDDDVRLFSWKRVCMKMISRRVVTLTYIFSRWNSVLFLFTSLPLISHLDQPRFVLSTLNCWRIWTRTWTCMSTKFQVETPSRWKNCTSMNVSIKDWSMTNVSVLYAINPFSLRGHHKRVWSHVAPKVHWDLAYFREFMCCLSSMRLLHWFHTHCHVIFAESAQSNSRTMHRLSTIEHLMRKFQRSFRKMHPSNRAVLSCRSRL